MEMRRVEYLDMHYEDVMPRLQQQNQPSNALRILEEFIHEQAEEKMEEYVRTKVRPPHMFGNIHNFYFRMVELFHGEADTKAKEWEARAKRAEAALAKKAYHQEFYQPSV